MRDIYHDWLQCTACGWIGKTESACMPELGNILSCPACTDLDVEEYHGTKAVIIPVDLLSTVLMKLGKASFMIGNPHFVEPQIQAERESIVSAYSQLVNFISAEGLMPADLCQPETHE